MWEERISPQWIDLACLYCAKRIFVKKDRYYKVIKARLDAKKTSGRRGALLIS
jgi:hypothetical protein